MNRGFFDQDRVWKDVNGTLHVLDEMDPDHRANLIPFLRARAEALYVYALDVNERQHVTHEVASRWLENTKLMRRLVEFEHQRGIDARRETAIRNAEYEARTGYKARRP